MTYTCERCNHTFKAKQGLQRHMDRKRPCLEVPKAVVTTDADITVNIKGITLADLKLLLGDKIIIEEVKSIEVAEQKSPQTSLESTVASLVKRIEKLEQKQPVELPVVEPINRLVESTPEPSDSDGSSSSTSEQWRVIRDKYKNRPNMLAIKRNELLKNIKKKKNQKDKQDKQFKQVAKEKIQEVEEKVEEVEVRIDVDKFIKEEHEINDAINDKRDEAEGIIDLKGRETAETKKLLRDINKLNLDLFKIKMTLKARKYDIKQLKLKKRPQDNLDGAHAFEYG